MISNQHGLPSAWRKCSVLLELICTTVSLVIISLYSQRRSCLSVTYSYIQLLLWVKASRLLIIYCGQFQTYTTHENDSVPITQLQYSVFFFFLVTHVFYLFLKVLLESSWKWSVFCQACVVYLHLPSFVG